MDSLTQALLGASTFALVKDKYIGKSSLVIGAIAGTIPDLDVLLAPFFNEVAFITVHRSYTHSILFVIIGSFFFGHISHRLSSYKYHLKNWILAFFLAFFTHSLLDWCTTYGTKLFCPFNGYLFSLNNIHVIEPVYTSILLVGVLVLFFKKKKVLNREKIIKWTLAISTFYMGWTFVSKTIANQKFVRQLQAQNIEYDKMLISPTPLNSLLWNGIIKTKNGYYFGNYSLLDSRKNIKLYFVGSKNELIPQIQKFKKGRQYLEYTNDFPLILGDKENIKIYAIKFGPINYFGKPEFVYPMCMNLEDQNEANFSIEYKGKQRGPVKNYKKLMRRIKGI